MGSNLKPNRKCPICGRRIVFAGWTWHANGRATADFYHGQGSAKPDPCTRIYPSHLALERIRKELNAP